MSSRLDLQSMVFDNTGRTDKITLTNNSLNFALKELSRRYPFEVLRPETDIDVTAGDISEDLPSALNHIIEVRLVDPAVPTYSFPMTIWRKIQFIEHFPNVAGSPITGRPTYCYIDEGLGEIFFDCKAMQAFIIRLTYYQLDSFSDDDSIATIEDADEVLVAYATASVYRGLQMYDDAKVWDQKFELLAMSLVNQAQREIGNKHVAQEWQNQDRRSKSSNGNPPWLDPWAGR